MQFMSMPQRARGITRPAAVVVLAVVGALVMLAVGQSGSASASPSLRKTWVVHKGGSIQAAVDKASSGDRIKIEAGTYHEAVCINGKGLTITGASRAKTIIAYPDWSKVSDLPAVASGNPCWVAHQKSDQENDQTTLNDDVSGLFFLNPSKPVKVSGLTTKNHPADGITVWGADGVDVHSTGGIAHDRYGIAVAASRHIVVRKNVEEGLTRPAPIYAGTGGVTVADTAVADASVRGNRVHGYNLGIFVREARGGELLSNRLTGNCSGILVFDDSAREIPDTAGYYQGGDWTIRKNVSNANDRYCIAGRDGSQRTSGIGIAVVNADKVVIKDNRISKNVPTVPAGEEPLNFPAAGIVLLGFAPPPGTSPPGAPSPGTIENVEVSGNRVCKNQPVDILLVQPTPQNPLILAPGPNIVIKNNKTS